MASDRVGGFSVRIGGGELDLAVDEALFGRVERIHKGDFAHAVGSFATLVAAVEVGEVLDFLFVAKPVLDEAI